MKRMHLDGQPVVPSQWAQKDPFSPAVKRRGADGTWSEVHENLRMGHYLLGMRTMLGLLTTPYPD